jgi:hypothetical protein
MDDRIVVNWQPGWEPTPDEDDPPPPSEWHDTPPPTGAQDWEKWEDE